MARRLTSRSASGLKEEISRAWKSAALADQAKSSFLSAASHDLRQPLQTLRFLQGALGPHLRMARGATSSAEWRDPSTPCPVFCRACLTSIVWRPGNLRPSRSDFAITEIFDSLAADFSDSIADKGLRWRAVRSGLVVRSDKRMLETMIRNLLSNALRYTDRGRILLGCRRGRRQGPDRGLGQRHRHHARSASSYISRSTIRARLKRRAGASDWVWRSSDVWDRCWTTDRCAFHSGQRHRDFD